MKNGTVTVRQWTGDLRKFIEFYKRCGYGSVDSVNQANLILIAEHQKQLVGAVRICDEQGAKVLRGMQVLPLWRGKRVVGPALLIECGCRIASECYLITYPNLAEFYSRILFRVIPDKQAPKFLRERVQGYRQ